LGEDSIDVLILTTCTYLTFTFAFCGDHRIWLQSSLTYACYSVTVTIILR
jgi:hypothetical protein